MRICDLIIVFISMCISLHASDDKTERHNLMPAPANISFDKGELVIDATFRVELTGFREPRLMRAAQRLIERITAQTGIIFLPEAGIEGADTVLYIDVGRPGEEVQSVEADESYRIVINSHSANLTAATPVGALRGLETFLQLIEPGQKGFRVPFVTIEDKPRFRWRGLLIDSCRHWMPPEVIFRTLDAMAAVKLNVLHWHLSEDQGFRVESKAFPKLHQMGSDGNYYSQDEIKEVVSYARDRGIRVVPEFDMPGHTTSWLVGYPELASAPGPYKIVRTWGVYKPVMDPTRKAVYEFIDKFIGEMVSLFPDEYFHIGGDEVEDDHWRENTKIQKFMAENNIKDSAELQAYFNRRVQEILKKHGKKMVGWDEILHPDLPKDIIVQSWRGQESLAEGARKGYYGIISNGYYIDLFYPASDHYAVDPLAGSAAELNAEERSRILGGEACMWGELITPELIDSRIWPRTAAIAERLWSPAAVKDVEDMYRRLEIQSRRLEYLGLNHRSFTRVLLERIVGPGESIEALLTLASAVEPIKGYARHHTRSYTSYTPMNRFVDAVPAESSEAREFNKRVELMLSSDEVWQQNSKEICKDLSKFKENHTLLLPLLNKNGILREVIPLSEDLSRLAEAGLSAIELIEQGERPSTSWIEKYADVKELREEFGREDIKPPEHELRIAIVPGVKKLVDRALSRN